MTILDIFEILTLAENQTKPLFPRIPFPVS